MPDANNVYMICPVRKAKPEIEEICRQHKVSLEREGIQVYFPPDDTNQNDDIGLKICLENRAGTYGSDRVDLYYDPDSQGSIFDFGMAFAFGKPVEVINPEAVLEKAAAYTGGSLEDSYLSMLMKYSINMQGESRLEGEMRDYLLQVLQTSTLWMPWHGRDERFLLKFGIAFAYTNRIKIEGQVWPERTPEKSFENVLLTMHEMTCLREVMAETPIQ